MSQHLHLYFFVVPHPQVFIKTIMYKDFQHHQVRGEKYHIQCRLLKLIISDMHLSIKAV